MTAKERETYRQTVNKTDRQLEDRRTEKQGKDREIGKFGESQIRVCARDAKIKCKQKTADI